MSTCRYVYQLLRIIRCEYSHQQQLPRHSAAVVLEYCRIQAAALLLYEKSGGERVHTVVPVHNTVLCFHSTLPSMLSLTDRYNQFLKDVDLR